METISLIAGILALLVLVAALLYWAGVRWLIVLEYERGLLYRSGKFQRVLNPGRYWYLRIMDTIYKVDVRSRFVSIPGQEVLSADNVSLKVSLAANFRVDDPQHAVNSTANYLEAVYLILQLQLRDLIGATPMDELLAKRKELGALLLEASKEKVSELGITLLSVNLKDIMFPGELKNIYAQVVSARNEGLAALERARGESAALRNLANAAKLLENNPALLQLRILQAVETSSGNTIMLAPTLDHAALVQAAKQPRDNPNTPTEKE